VGNFEAGTTARAPSRIFAAAYPQLRGGESQKHGKRMRGYSACIAKMKAFKTFAG
jgi:hypothetical protein